MCSRKFLHVLQIVLVQFIVYSEGRRKSGSKEKGVAATGDENYVRHVVEDGVKPPIFGSGSYDPVRQVFEPPEKRGSTTTKSPPDDASTLISEATTTTNSDIQLIEQLIEETTTATATATETTSNVDRKEFGLVNIGEETGATVKDDNQPSQAWWSQFRRGMEETYDVPKPVESEVESR